MSKSIEEKVEDYFKDILDKLGIKRYGKTESINTTIKHVLESAKSKKGGKGGNYPDIQILLDNHRGRTIPVMMEVKGTKNRLKKLNKAGELAKDQSAIANYAVNGAYHYGLAILQNTNHAYKEVIVVGMNASDLNIDLEVKAYYLAESNGYVPKEIGSVDSTLKIFAEHNIEQLYKELDNLKLTEEEQAKEILKTEESFDQALSKIHDSIYKNKQLKSLLNTTDKLYLFSGLIIASLKVKGVGELPLDFLQGSMTVNNSDGAVIIRQIESVLSSKSCPNEIFDYFKHVFMRQELWRYENGESLLKVLYKDVITYITPHFSTPYRIDFANRLLNQLNLWVSIENDKENDVVTTPRPTVDLMLNVGAINENTRVLDSTAGAGGFLVAGIDAMVRNAEENTIDKKELDLKIENIKTNQVMGIEILQNIHILAVLSMLLLDGNPANIYNGDSHNFSKEIKAFDPTLFVLNPPYSTEGKGLIFVEEATRNMTSGRACVLIQDTAGSGQGGIWSRKLLEHNTLLASISMPEKLFIGKANVNTAIYVFEVNKPHNKDSLVKFIDFSDDGYTRSGKKKQKIKIRDTGNAKDRYKEVADIILNKKPKTEYYTKENGLYIEDTITLNGDDWNYLKHKTNNLRPTQDHFNEVMNDYLQWSMKLCLSGDQITQEPREDKVEELVKPVGYKDFKVNEIFNLQTSIGKINASETTIYQRKLEGSTLYISRTERNNGCKGYIIEKEKRANSRNTISFGQDTGTVFYQPNRYYTGSNIKIFTLKDHKLNEEIGLYLVTCLQKAFEPFKWGNSFKIDVIENVKFNLPITKQGEPAWVFMEKYMHQLKQEQKTKLIENLSDLK